jgi:3-oxoacyl-[acyl-carrier-protein] synthase II
MALYIVSASSITHQNSFNQAGFSAQLQELTADSTLIKPDYKTYINPALVRRMSDILRMSVACSADCLRQANLEQVGPIIVGTGLGCLLDTEKFLNNALTIEGSLLPPTSFIQSTHNTIAGQISLSIQNHEYNMTHTQNSLSFERSLEDAFLSIAEGHETVLVGAADEVIQPMQDIFNQLGLAHLPLTTGASFFVVSPQNNHANVCIKAAKGLSLVDVNTIDIDAFLQENNCHKSDIDLVLYATTSQQIAQQWQTYFNAITMVDYAKYSGYYATSSAFATHLAQDIITTQPTNFCSSNPVKRVLICNAINPTNLGLILVESV